MNNNIDLIVPKAGIGSFFNEESKAYANLFPVEGFLGEYQLFYAGRHALKHIIDTLQEQKEIRNLWMPSYYCQDVVKWLQVHYKNMLFYDVDPFSFDNKPDPMGFANEKDIVVLNNFWGLSEYIVPAVAKRPIIIEDHSHGWLSDSCVNSNADYCFASLRKSLPVPMAGIGWSPKHQMPIHTKGHVKDVGYYGIWDALKEAMALKKDYIQDVKGKIEKDDYLSITYRAEEDIHHNYALAKLKKEHEDYINRHLRYDIWHNKKKNLDFLLPRIDESAHFKVVNNNNKPSFGLPLAFKEKSIFDDFKNHMIKNDIYPTFYWADNPEIFDYKYLFIIHVDFRYSHKHMEYITSCINGWGKQNK